ncbi:MAG: phytanoyl-CoA dioxygenase family protein [Acidiphilium sp.]
MDMVRFADLVAFPDEAELPPLDRATLDPAGLNEDQRAWVRDGVVLKRKFIPDDLLDAYIARRAAYRPGTSRNKVGWLHGHCYIGVPELRAVALYPPLMDMLASLIGEEMIFHLALTGWVSTQREWHQDDYLNPDFVNTWYAAVWIALEDIDPESGPFEYLPGSHRWGLLRGEKIRAFLTDEERERREPVTGINQWPSYAEQFVTPAIEEQIAQSGLPVVPFLGQKGDVLIWHSRLMHRGSRRKSDMPRRSLITHYSGINHRPDMLLKARDENGRAYAVFDMPPDID